MERSITEESQEKMRAFLNKKELEEEQSSEAEDLAKTAAGAAIVGSLVGSLLKPVVLMLLWNWLMPGLFGLATIGYLKAFGLYIISRILFDKHG